MDFLNKAMQQIGEVLKAMSPAARFTAALLLAVVVISLVYLFRYQGNSPNNYLLAGRSFSSSELAAMEGAFSQAGLNDYEIEGSKVRVPLSQRAAYLAALAEYNALPQNFESVLAEALSTNSPFESQSAREERIQYALQRELSRIIKRMRGIEDANVYFDEITERGLRAQRKYTASVSVQPTGSGSMDTSLVDSIRKFVAAAKAGMKPEDVTVTDLSTGQAYTISSDEVSQLSSFYQNQKQSFEQEWRKKIVEHLNTFIDGVQVGVNVEIDSLLEHETLDVQADSRITPIEQDEQSSTHTTQSGSPGGQPGVVPNASGPNSGAVVSSSQQQQQIEERSNHQVNFPAHSVQRRREAPLTPTNVTVSVAVPSTYYEKLWLQENPAAEGEEQELPQDGALQQLEQEVRDKIQEQVVALLPPALGGENAYPHVVVTSFTRISTPSLEEPGWGITVWDWFADHGSQVAMMVAGLFGLLILRGVVRGGSGSNSPAPVDNFDALEQPVRMHEEHAEEHDGEEESPATPKRKRKFAAGGPNLRDELADMVREDPDTAANILKSWISDAA